MRDRTVHASGLAESLRATFARSFAEPAFASGAMVDLLSIRVAGESRLIRLAQVAGLFADRAVTPVPSDVAAFSGITGLRGAILPVYDLALLLGLRPVSSPRWMIVSMAEAVALRFDAFEGHLRLPEQTLAAEDSDEPGRLREVYCARGTTIPVVHLPPIVDAIGRLARPANSKGEI